MITEAGRRMPRALRWVAWTLVSLTGVALLLAGAVYVRSEMLLRRTYTVPAASITVPTDSATLVLGERLARVRGCLGGCHGERLEGKVFFDQPRVARLVAPDLTAAVARFSDAELAGIIRHGVRPNGRGVFGMPATAFRALSDEDLGAILGYLRSAPAESGLPASLRVGPLGRLGLVLGQYHSEATVIAHDSVHPPARTPRQPLSDYGRYLALSICSECHGADLHGNPPNGAPDLRIVIGYGPSAFARLLKEGVPLDGRTLGLMGRVARTRFSHLTPYEVAALYDYLHSRHFGVRAGASTARSARSPSPKLREIATSRRSER